MDQGFASAAHCGAEVFARKSWTAWVRPLALGLLVLFPIAAAAWQVSAGLGLVMLVGAVVFVAYEVLLIRSFQLLCDQSGIWLRFGLLPWSRGVIGVKWRDLDEARYLPGFINWVFHSYAIRIDHRYTKSNEIRMSHVHRGNQAVEAINARHQDLARRGLLG